MTAESKPALLMITGDLFFSSKVVGTAEQFGYELHVEADWNTWHAKHPDDGLDVIILDLAAPRLDIAAMMADLPTERRPHVIAYGSHVAKALLDNARAMGCDEVLTKGQFAANVSDVLRRRMGTQEN